MLFHILRLLEEQRQVHLQVSLVYNLKGRWSSQCQWQRWSIWPAGADMSWHVFSLLFGTYIIPARTKHGSWWSWSTIMTLTRRGTTAWGTSHLTSSPPPCPLRSSIAIFLFRIQIQRGLGEKFTNCWNFSWFIALWCLSFWKQYLPN